MSGCLKTTDNEQLLLDPQEESGVSAFVCLWAGKTLKLQVDLKGMSKLHMPMCVCEMTHRVSHAIHVTWEVCRRSYLCGFPLGCIGISHGHFSILYRCVFCTNCYRTLFSFKFTQLQLLTSVVTFCTHNDCILWCLSQKCPHLTCNCSFPINVCMLSFCKASFVMYFCNNIKSHLLGFVGPSCCSLLLSLVIFA